jgi:hypothetical protein
MDPRWYYIGPWETDPEDGTYVPPAGTVGLIDLSGDTPGSIGFFATEKALDDSTLIALGDEKGTRIDSYKPTEAQRVAWGKALSLTTPKEATLLDLLWDVLTVDSDADGIAHAKPIMPTSKGSFELWLGGHSLVRTRKMPSDVTTVPHWPKMQSVLRADYSRARAESESERASLLRPGAALRKRLDVMAERAGLTRREVVTQLRKRLADHPRKWLGYQARKYRLTAAQASALITDDGAAPISPETSYSDTFTRTGSDLGTGWSDDGSNAWTTDGDEAVVASGGSNPCYAVYTSDLSGSDMEAYTSAARITSGGGSRLGLAVRMSADTNYMGGANTRGTDNIEIRRRYTIYETSLLSTPTVATLGEGPWEITLTADGSTITVDVDGESDNVTDTAVSSGTRAGLEFRQQYGAAYWADWSAEDLASATTTSRLTQGGLIRGGVLMGGRLVG